MLGIFLVSSNAVVGFCWSGLLLLYAQRIPREEAMMLNQFGDGYRRYMNRTGRWIPRLRLDRDITER